MRSSRAVIFRAAQLLPVTYPLVDGYAKEDATEQRCLWLPVAQSVWTPHGWDDRDASTKAPNTRCGGGSAPSA